MPGMETVTQPDVKTTDRPLRLPRVTPEWVALLEAAAAERGLPPDPWPLP